MTTRRSAVLLAFVLAGSAAGCGKVGPIQPPLVLIPQKIDSLAVLQLGGEIVLSWKNPEKFIDGRPLGTVAEVEIWLEKVVEAAPPAATPPFDPDEFLTRARLVAAVPPDKLVLRPPKADDPAVFVSTRIPIADENLSKFKYLFAVRVREGRRKKLSEFSNAVQIKPELVPMPPDNVRAAVFEDRIEIRWDAPFENFDHSTPARVRGYNIYKLAENTPERKLNDAPVDASPFADRDFAFGAAVRYFVRAVASSPQAALESLESAVVEVVPKDTFPPAVPAGLTTVAGADLITLIWDLNRELDLLGYKVWRRLEGAAEFALLSPQPLLENTYTDKAVEKGKRYEYAITSVDLANNESGRSAAVSEIIKDP